MVVEFSIAYHTVLGQEIRLLPYNKERQRQEDKVMKYIEGFWTLLLEELTDDLFYRYGLFENGQLIELLNRDFSLSIENCQQEKVIVKDEWIAQPTVQPILQTRPFKNIFGKTAQEEITTRKKKKWSHKIVLHTLPMQQHLVPCITGSGNLLGDWDTTNPLLMQQVENGWELSFLMKEASVEYKVALYDKYSHNIIAYQSSENSLLPAAEKKEQIIKSHG